MEVQGHTEHAQSVEPAAGVPPPWPLPRRSRPRWGLPEHDSPSTCACGRRLPARPAMKLVHAAKNRSGGVFCRQEPVSGYPQLELMEFGLEPKWIEPKRLRSFRPPGTGPAIDFLRAATARSLSPSPGAGRRVTGPENPVGCCSRDRARQESTRKIYDLGVMPGVDPGPL